MSRSRKTGKINRERRESDLGEGNSAFEKLKDLVEKVSGEEQIPTGDPDDDAYYYDDPGIASPAPGNAADAEEMGSSSPVNTESEVGGSYSRKRDTEGRSGREIPPGFGSPEARRILNEGVKAMPEKHKVDPEGRRKAFALLLKARDMGCPDANYYLGDLYNPRFSASAPGTEPVDYQKAVMFYSSVRQDSFLYPDALLSRAIYYGEYDNDYPRAYAYAVLAGLKNTDESRKDEFQHRTEDYRKAIANWDPKHKKVWTGYIEGIREERDIDRALDAAYLDVKGEQRKPSGKVMATEPKKSASRPAGKSFGKKEKSGPGWFARNKKLLAVAAAAVIVVTLGAALAMGVLSGKKDSGGAAQVPSWFKGPYTSHTWRHVFHYKIPETWTEVAGSSSSNPIYQLKDENGNVKAKLEILYKNDMSGSALSDSEIRKATGLYSRTLAHHGVTIRGAGDSDIEKLSSSSGEFYYLVTAAEGQEEIVRVRLTRPAGSKDSMSRIRALFKTMHFTGSDYEASDWGKTDEEETEESEEPQQETEQGETTEKNYNSNQQSSGNWNGNSQGQTTRGSSGENSGNNSENRSGSGNGNSGSSSESGSSGGNSGSGSGAGNGSMNSGNSSGTGSGSGGTSGGSAGGSSGSQGE